METALFSGLESGLIDLLSPVIGSASEGRVKGVEVRPFARAEDVHKVLQDYRDDMPSAFLNRPKGTYPALPENLRVPEAVADYALLVGDVTHDKVERRGNWLYLAHDQVLSRLFYAEFPGNTVAAQFVDFIQPQAYEFLEAPGVAALLVTFRVHVKNWLIN